MTAPTAYPASDEPHNERDEEAPGCVLAAPSCFGFVALLCLLIGACAVHDLAI